MAEKRPAPSAASLRRRRERGILAEATVARYLETQGLRVLERNVRVGRLEIDLIARDGDVIVIVEVRTRGEGSWQRALESIDTPKQARVRAAGERLWSERFASDASAARMRFDAATVTFDADGTMLVEHVRAAF